MTDRESGIGPSVDTLHQQREPEELADLEVAAFLRVVGRRIRLLRHTQELSQDQLATATGISRSFISLIEHGERGANVTRLYKLARVLGVEPWELLQPASQR